MRRTVFALVLGIVVVASATAHGATSNTTATQLTKRFKLSTGEKLVPNKLRSSAGHYKAYDLGVQTAFSKARWGTFTVYLVTGSDVEADVKTLLANTRTGALDKPSAGGIYWEPGATLYGDAYWLAKRRYGQNVVLTWIGSTPVKKTDASWKRLHTALTAATK